MVEEVASEEHNLLELTSSQVEGSKEVGDRAEIGESVQGILKRISGLIERPNSGDALHTLEGMKGDKEREDGMMSRSTGVRNEFEVTC